MKLATRKGQELQTWYQLPLDFLVAFWVKELVKHRRNSFTTSPRIKMEKVMKEKAYISQKLGNSWLPCGGTNSTEFKNQQRQPFLLRSMVYRYLKYYPGVEQMPTSNFELDLYLECHPEALSNCDNDVVEVQQLNLGVHTQKTIQEMPNPNTIEPKETIQEILAQEIPMLQRAPISLLGKLRHSSHPSLQLQTTTWKSFPLQLCINRLVCPLSPMASVREVAVLIEDYTQLLDATSQELYMLDQWIYSLGQLTPYGKIDFTFFDLPDGMPPPQGDTLSWNVLQA
ncbi:hypothetical protein SELMODRAFT_420987 [Selaginella moellendorffii]|uniref:Uncharacterized protein n=1 Tax=Selaginella moellendorffii TaxID=88036 RepID=D8SDS1_SELML|nr:hypothetical protein SELMODRAFT_420987 [Selaginella moellendorffii]